jgi:hypothetical protein
MIATPESNVASPAVSDWQGGDRDGTRAREGLADSYRKDALNLLMRLTNSSDADAWELQPIDQGHQACMLLARRRDGRVIWQEHTQVVVKLFHSHLEEIKCAAHAQQQLLSVLESRLNGLQIDGWSIHTPRPILTSQEPLLTVMTVVPGKRLHDILESCDVPTADLIKSTAGVVASTMWRLWDETGEVHGDLHFENILCDVERRAISFVDPGPPRSSWYCDQTTKLWYPASRDLAYLLFDVVTCSLKVALRRPRGARRQREFAEDIVRSVIARIESGEDKRLLLEEVRSCIGLHLAQIRAGWTPIGMWRGLVKVVASRMIARILRRLASNSDHGGRCSAASAGNRDAGEEVRRHGREGSGSVRHRPVGIDRASLRTAEER